MCFLPNSELHFQPIKTRARHDRNAKFNWCREMRKRKRMQLVLCHISQITPNFIYVWRSELLPLLLLLVLLFLPWLGWLRRDPGTVVTLCRLSAVPSLMLRRVSHTAYALSCFHAQYHLVFRLVQGRNAWRIQWQCSIYASGWPPRRSGATSPLGWRWDELGEVSHLGHTRPAGNT